MLHWLGTFLSRIMLDTLQPSPLQAMVSKEHWIYCQGIAQLKHTCLPTGLPLLYVGGLIYLYIPA